MQEWIIAMLVISVLLILRDMAKTILTGRMSKKEEIFPSGEDHPQKEKVERYAAAFQKLADTFYGMPYKKEYLSSGQIERILRDANDRLCSNCYHREICWGSQAETMCQGGEALVRALEKDDEGELEKLRMQWGSVCGKSLQYLEEVREQFRQEKQNLIDQNEELKNTVDTLTEQNNILIQNQSELSRLQELYDLDAEYSDYPKVAARIISKDPGNWYDTFMINKGSKDGIRVDNNVIAGKGLVGIVTEVGSNWATVRSIIDDSSNVSAMTVGTDDNCVVEGDLELIDEGKLRFTQLYDKEDKVTVGEQVVTSNISEKYVEGLFIGYVSDIQLDTNNLTKSGTIVTPVDFQHLKDVFVITVNKKDSTEEGAEE